MKKTFLTIICGVALSSSAFAQGWINYSLSFTSITAVTNTSISPLFGGSGAGGTSGSIGTQASGFSYVSALLYQPSGVVGVFDTNVWDGTWQSTAFGGIPMTGTNGTTAGRLSTTGGSGNVQVPWSNGTTNDIVVVIWSANLGASWSSVSNYLANWSTLGQTVVGPAYFGETSLGYINPNAVSPGAAMVGSGTATANGLPIFSLNTPLFLLPVPEPSTMALAGLGGLAVLLFRRRK